MLMRPVAGLGAILLMICSQWVKSLLAWSTLRIPSHLLFTLSKLLHALSGDSSAQSLSNALLKKLTLWQLCRFMLTLTFTCHWEWLDQTLSDPCRRCYFYPHELLKDRSRSQIITLTSGWRTMDPPQEVGFALTNKSFWRLHSLAPG